jgi:hypothetical protein
MNQEIVQVVTDFNNTLLSLAMNVASICPTTIIGSNMKDIEKAIKRKDNLTKFIDLFCIKVLQYKDKIDAGDESFFLTKDYTSDLGDQDSSYLSHVLSFKDIWGKLKKENKSIVLVNMQILCELSQQYYEYILSLKTN